MAMHASAPVEKLTPEKVRSEVKRFWDCFSAKQDASLMEFYAPESTVFSSIAARLEPGRLAATRRKREYFHGHGAIMVRLGMVEVQMLGDHSAVAAYNFEFHAKRLGANTTQLADEHVKNGRATQVFGLDMDGQLRILHEHLSALE